MLRFILCKIRNKKWMILSLLLGNLLMVAITASSSMYSQAALQRMLTNNLGEYMAENNKYPGTITIYRDCTIFGEMTSSEYDKIDKGTMLLDEMTEELRVPLLNKGIHYHKPSVVGHHETAQDGEENLRLKASAYTDLEDHVNMISGQMYTAEIVDNIFDIVVNEKTFVEQKLMMGEIITIDSLKDKSGAPYKMRVAGVFECKDPQDTYWIANPNSWKNVCMMDDAVFLALFVDPERMNVNYNMEWFAVLDYGQMRGDRAQEYMDILEKYIQKYDAMKIRNITPLFVPVLEDFLVQAQKLNTTIWILQLPILVLLISFIFMVSRQMLEMEQNEISIYKSRGANKGQIVGLYLLQSLLIAGVSLAGGLWLGVFMCNMLGASNSFLEFVKRTALPVEVGSQAVLLAVIAALFSVGTMVFPVIRYANVNIVDHKRKKNRAGKAPVWQLVGLDVILIAVAVYFLYQFNQQKEYLAQQIADGGSLDPFLYMCSSLFMVGVALLILRIFPWVVKFIFWTGKKMWSPALYSSFLRIIRTRSNQGFLMVFLILTVSMGIYNAQAARTINANGQDKIQYVNGAELVLQESWKNIDGGLGTSGSEDAVYVEPSFEKYLQMDGIESITKVLVENKVSVSVDGGRVRNATVMGIHTKEFGETALFKEELLPIHYNEYLNAISQNSQAILVSSNFHENFGYQVGDVLVYSNQAGENLRGIIYGFVDYWPAYVPKVRAKGTDGIYTERENYLIVAHLAQIQSSWGITPYQVWIKTNGSTQFIYDFAEETDTKFTVFKDTTAELIALKNDPIFQGTNGILTIGFICILVLCAMGFLIYWILSIQSRTLQFGIFRAMGMSMGEVFAMLLNEQLFITGVSIGAGIGVGILTSRVFVPLIQIASSSADQVIPLEIVSESSDYVRLFAVIGVAIFVCLGILGWLISKIKISQALKLGED